MPAALRNREDDDSTVGPTADACIAYVSPDGSDNGDGSRESPCATLSHAVNAAVPQGLEEIRLAVGVYEGDLDPVGGIDIVGGFDAGTWEVSADDSTVIRPLSGPVVANGITVETPMERHVIQAPIATAASPNATALVLTECGPELRFEACRIAAGTGYAGETGAPGEDVEDGIPGTTGNSYWLGKGSWRS